MCHKAKNSGVGVFATRIEETGKCSEVRVVVKWDDLGKCEYCQVLNLEWPVGKLDMDSQNVDKRR